MTKKNSVISILRVVAMLAIILLHLFSYFGIYEYGILNIFIYVFFIISGYLYSNKKIDNKKDFIISRIKKILIPLWIWSFIISIITAVSGKIKLAISSFFISLFNLHGLDYLFFGHHILDNFQVEGLIHCWFITVIMACYLSLIFIKGSKIEEYIEKNRILSMTIFIIFQVLLALLLNVQIAGILAFYFGYYCLSDRNINIKNCLLYFIVSLLLGFARIYLHAYIDGTIFYDQVIQPYFNISSAMFIVVIALLLYQNNPMIKDTINDVSKNNIFRWFEKNSYYLFIVHYAFLYQPFNFLLFGNFKIIIFSLSLFLSAQILNVLTNLIAKNK